MDLTPLLVVVSVFVGFILILVFLRRLVFRQGWPHWTGFEGITVMKLLELLIVPFVIATGAFLLQQGERNRQNDIERQRREASSTLEAERLQENTLQAYLDDMTTLILNQDLPTCPVNTAGLAGNARNTWIIAETRTKAVMRQMDGDRNDDIVRLLAGANLTCLIGDDIANINLSAAELGSASLVDMDLSNSELAFANLNNADLSGANLSGADLFEADLTNAAIDESTRFDTTTILPDSTFWTPNTDLERFTDPNHPGYWRSFNDDSPAYVTIATQRPTSTPGEMQVVAATQAAATNTPSPTDPTPPTATPTPRPSDTPEPTQTPTDIPTSASTTESAALPAEVELIYSADWLLIINVTGSTQNLGNLDFVWTGNARQRDFEMDADFSEGDDNDRRFRMEPGGCLELLTFPEASRQAVDSACELRYGWMYPGDDDLFWLDSANDNAYFEVFFAGERVAVCGVDAERCAFALTPQDPLPGTELLDR